MKTLNRILLGVSMMATLAACDKEAGSFSLLSASSTFKQGTAIAPKPVDILWVVDSSGSMATSQQNLANNFRSFIQGFQTKNFDFHMAVSDTMGYYSYFYDNSYSKFKDGSGANHSGVFVMDKDTPNLEQVFTTNVKVGTNGSGDERAFSSFEHTLTNPLNAGFLRPGAILIVIIVSDEDDFSHNDWSPTKSYYFTENYADPKMFSIQYYVDFLSNLTNSTQTVKNFMVHSISITDAACLAQLQNNAQKVSQRYQQLAAATGGISSSLCQDMGVVLDTLSTSIISLASAYTLDREPWENTIRVTVDGVDIPRDPVNGWSYDSATWTITFSPSATPAQGQDVRVYFEPKNPQ